MELEKIIRYIKQIDEYPKLNIADIKKCIESDDFLIRSDIVQAVTRFIGHDKIYEIIKEATKDRNYICLLYTSNAALRSSELSPFRKRMTCAAMQSRNVVQFTVVVWSKR